MSTAVGDEGGFAPDLASNEVALQVIVQAVEQAGYKPGKDVYLGLDVASSEFFRDGKYEFAAEHRSFSSAEFSRYLAERDSDLLPEILPLCQALAGAYFTSRYIGFDLEDPDWPTLRAQPEAITALAATIRSRIPPPLP